jgi:prephenate dehydrogenase
MTVFPRLKDTAVAILGLGLMGGSLALALRGKCAQLLGIDRDPAVRALALQKGIVDQVSGDPAALLPQAGLVVLATPVRTILANLEELPGLHPGPAVVLDLGSTKNAIAESMSRLPDRFDPIGGHPMCGKEHSGLAQAEAGIYKGAPFALTPLPRTSQAARSLAEELARAVGAQPVWLDPQTHDRWVAATSHLPYLIANALAGSIPVEARAMIGPGYRSTSRLAVSPVEIMMDVLITNREPVLDALRRFMGQLALIENCLASQDDDTARRQLARSAGRQARLLEPTADGGAT